jgi:tRNA pseudouridine32 synthase / 23S rRNA pseudouridine746 synthase
MSIPVLYEDDCLLVVNKPTNLLCVPGRGPDKQDCVIHRLQNNYPDALVVHRLDMDTSGVMLFARTAEAQRELNRQFEARETGKKYIALVTGELPELTGLVDAPMRKDMEQRLPPRHIIDWEQGKAASTRWHVLDFNGEWSRVRLFPETGRSHQLRVHMKYLDCPIVGDPIYGAGKNQASRLMLHAETIQFMHPSTGESLLFMASVPF